MAEKGGWVIPLMPVLKHTEGEGDFTFTKNGGWKVSSGVPAFWDYLHSGSSPSLCPEDPRGPRNEIRGQKCWRYTPKFKLDRPDILSLVESLLNVQSTSIKCSYVYC